MIQPSSYQSSIVLGRAPLPLALRGVTEQPPPPKRINSKALEELAGVSLMKPKEGLSGQQITQINDRYCLAVAQISSLYHTICSKGSSDHDAATIQALRDELNAIKETLPKAERKQAKAHIRMAEQELDRLDELSRLLPAYRAAECVLDEAIRDVSSHDRGAHFSFAAATEALELFERLSNGIGKDNPLQPMLRQTREELVWVFDEWADDLVRDTEDEIDLLWRIHQTPSQSDTALSLLESLRQRLDVDIDKLDELASQARQLGLHDSAERLRDAKQELEKHYDRLSNSLPEETPSSIAYGSSEWQTLHETVSPPERGLIGQIFHPDEWSDTTKDRVFRMMAAAQLLAQGASLYRELSNHEGRKALADALQREVIAAVPPETMERIGKEASMLERFLVEKYSALSNPATLQALTKRHPEIRPALEAAMQRFGPQQPGTDAIRSVTEAYKLQRCIQESPKADPTRYMSFGEWWEALKAGAEESPKPEIKLLSADPLPAIGIASSAGQSTIQRFARWMGLVQESSPVIQEQSLAAQTEVIRTIQRGRELHDQVVLSGNPRLEPLRELVTLSLGALMKSARQVARDDLSVTQLADAIQLANDQCFAIEELEQLITKEMESVRESVRGDVATLEAGGKKHTNIILQDRVVKALGIPGIEVPIPVALESQQVHAFLREKAPEVFTHWEALDALHTAFTGPGIFFETEAAQAHINAIDEAITHAFAAEDAYDRLHLSPEMESLLERTRRSGDYLMVRSTGSEDSRQAAVAGGNVSSAYVSPDKSEICQALGKTVSSYFGAKSLQIRLDAGEIPFKQELKLAVTVQPLIGEPIGGATNPDQIPVSLVLFSNEPLYVGNETWRLMRISAAYGHGEGVVGNMGISSDTYLLMISEADPEKLYIIRDVKDKPERLAPVMGEDGKVALQKISNPKELRHQPALTDAGLARLYHYGVIGEKFFQDRGTDMEVVVKESTIYPVQARPVNRPAMLPTYIDMRKIETESAAPIQKTLYADLLVAGKASVVEITDRDQVLTAATLEEAEKKYDKNVHKLVVVHQDEPSNSHPVVNFSNLGMPCLVAKDAAAVKDLTAKIDARHPLAVCVQTGAMHLWDSSQGAIGDYVVHGFGVHPAKIAQSMPTPISGPALEPSREIPQEVKALLIAVRSATTQEAASRALSDLQQTNWVTDLRERSAFAASVLQSETALSPEVRERFALITNFGKKWNKAVAEAEATLTSGQEGDRLKPLFRAKVIESLLVGRADKGGSLGQFSAVDILAIDREIGQLTAYQSALAHPAHLIDLVLLGNKGITDEARDAWTGFLSNLEPHIESGTIPNEKIEQFKSLMQTLGQTRSLPTWLTLFFAQTLKEQSTPQLQLEAMLQSLPSADNTFVQQQQQRMRELQTLAHQIDRFGDPKNFEEAWKSLLQYAAPSAQKEFGDYMRNHASPMAQLIATGAMWELVDTFDRAIKAMLASPQWNQEEKVPIFKKMLQEYLTLLNSWHHDLIKPGAMVDTATVDSYLNRLGEVFQQLPDRGEEQLRSVASYSVDAALITSETAFGRHLPPNLEALFSVVHQNLIACHSHIINTLVTPERVAASLLPQSIKEAVSLIAAHYPMRTGVEVNEQQIAFHFNIPLRNHSAKLNIVYDRANESLLVNGQFFGEARDRWGDIAILGLILDSLGIANLAEPMVVEDFEAAATWKLAHVDELPRLLKVFEEMCAMTFISTRSDAFKRIMERYPLSESDINRVALDVFQRSSHSDNNLLRAASISLATELMKQSQYLEEIITLQTELAKDDRPAMKVHVLKLLQTLLQSGYAHDSAIAAATEAMKNASSDVRAHGLQLFQTLVRSGYAYDSAADAAAKAIRSNHLPTRAEGMKVFLALADRDVMHDLSAAAIEEAVRDPEDSVQKLGLQVLQALAHKDRAQDLVIAVASEVVKSGDHLKRVQGFTLFRTLVKNGRAYDSAANVAVEAMKHDDPRVRANGFILFTDLFDKGQGFNAAITTAAEGVEDANRDIRELSFNLFHTLVKLGQGYDAAAGAATKAFKERREAGMNLFQALFNKGQGYDSAAAAATEAVKDRRLEIRGEGFDLFQSLVERGQGYDAAAAAAAEAMKDDVWGIRWYGLRLFQALVNKNQSIDSAAAAAAAAVKDIEQNVVSEGSKLLETLADNGYI